VQRNFLKIQVENRRNLCCSALSRAAGRADGVTAIVKNNKKPGAVTRPGAISQFQFPE
jgi:hypothetical protein